MDTTKELTSVDIIARTGKSVNVECNVAATDGIFLLLLDNEDNVVKAFNHSLIERVDYNYVQKKATDEKVH